MRCTVVRSCLGLLVLAQGALADVAPNSIRMIIKYNSTLTTSALESKITQTTSLSIGRVTPMANGAYSVILNTPGLTNEEKEDTTHLILAKISEDPNVRYAVKDRIGHFKPLPDPEINPQFSTLLSHETQWDEFSAPSGVMLESKAGLRDGAWAYTTGKATKPVVVAVLDTGIALNDSLINNLVKDSEGTVWGWNFSANNNDLADETTSYHGTHVAGTIAGYGQVVSGMGEDLKILPIKIPDKTGMFYESSVINGIYWSVGAAVPFVPVNIHPAKVLNMSFGVDFGPGREIDYCDAALQEAVFFARKKGAVLVVAAGNDNLWEHLNAPAACNGTIKVASTGPEGLRSYFSNYGPSITFAAPGGDKRYGIAGGILSTVNPSGGYHGSGFDFYQGTSMATPHVSGVAGLVYSVANKNITAEKVEQILYTSTHDFGKNPSDDLSCVGKKPCGHGILDAENAVKATLNNYDVFLTAPKSADLSSKVCKNKFLKSGLSTWIKIKGTCASDYQSSRLFSGEGGDIFAQYGSVIYKLDQSLYKACQIIGYDGVGCIN